jgi:hypothetical protein
VPDSFTWNQFAGGWQPSADAVNGPKNCLLQMDNLELDKTGALSLVGGTAVVTSILGSTYPFNAHTITSFILNGTRCDYVADIIGQIYRNGIPIAPVGPLGSSTNAAFSTAYYWVLACSGTVRVKDNGAGLTYPLGLTTPPGVGLAEVDGYLYCNVFNSTASVQVKGTKSSLADNIFSGVQSDPTTLTWIWQSYTQSSPALPVDTTVFTASNSLSQSIPYVADPTDYFVLYFATSAAGANVLGLITSITFDVLLAAPDSSGDVVSDYFTFTYSNPGGAATQSQFSLVMPRQNFTRVGSSNASWNSVYGCRITIIGNSNFNIPSINLFESMVAAGLPGSNPTGSINNGIPFNYAISPNGSGYQFAQMNVNSNSGAYTGLSQLSAASGVLYPNNNTVQILPDIVGLEAQVDQIWIFAIGNNLEQWYRILVFESGSFSTPQYWATTDAAIQTIDITANLNLITVNSTGITDSIYDIIGPIEGRWFYFTSQFMYPSDINDPDLVDVTLGVRTCGQAELYLWARRISYNSVIVGTNRDCYLLTGTFVTLPDGTVDIYYQSLGCKYPPIAFDATFSSGQVFYMAADGWRSIDGNGNCINITVPLTDRLYRGITAYGYSVDVQVIPGTVRFPVVLARNKLWCSITGQSRMEVLDSTRGYWRNFAIGKGDCLAICSTQDGGILGFFASDKKLRLLDQQSSLQIDSTTNQTVTVLSPVFDGGTPKQRKDAYTLNLRVNTGALPLAVYLIDDTNTTTYIGSVTTGALVETTLDVSQLVPLLKTFQFGLTGSFSAFTLDDITFYFDTRPPQLTHIHLLPENYGTTGRKRIPTIPFVIDTLGNNGTFTPILDGVTQTALTVSSNRKQSFDYETLLDLYGVDWEFLVSGGPFEFFGVQQPQYMEKFPEPIKFYTIPVTNFGTMARKHFRKWRFVLDPRGGTITFTPIIDGSSGSTTNYSFTGKETVAAYFTADQVGTDFSGTFSSSTAFELWDILKPDPEDMEVLPDAIEYQLILPNNFGSSARKHIRKFSFMLDPMGNNVVFTPIVDGSSLSTTTFTGTGKETFVRFFTVDEIGIDWGGTLVGSGPFEIYNIIPPTKDEIDVLPEQIEFYLIKPSNLGSASRKRLGEWPFVLDTLGNSVVFTPIIDGASGTPTTFVGSNGKQTFFHYFTVDTIGTDFGGTLTGGPFEIYEIGTPV